MFLFGETRSILLWDETYDESCYFNVHEFDPLYHEKYIEIKFDTEIVIKQYKLKTSCESDVKWSFRYTVVTYHQVTLSQIYRAQNTISS
jgi:hypothetical protein